MNEDWTSVHFCKISPKEKELRFYFVKQMLSPV